MRIIMNIRAYHVKIVVRKSPQGMGAATRSTTNAEEDEDEIKRMY